MSQLLKRSLDNDVKGGIKPNILEAVFTPEYVESLNLVKIKQMLRFHDLVELLLTEAMRAAKDYQES
jgi:hypothetical protein